jgi:type VI secretion system protein ImpJ
MIRSRRITGAPRKLVQDEELYELMPSRGVIIFEIAMDPEFIQADQNLNIFNPTDTHDKRPVEMMLYVKKAPIDEKGGLS